jgi:branched-chain amino acid transport system substrate-binding protein
MAVMAHVAENCTTQGYNPIYVTEGTGFTNLALTTPGLKDRLWSSYPILPYFSGSPAVAAMNAAVNKYSPGVLENTQTWSEFAAQAWTAGLLLAQAVKNAGVTASDTVTAATITDGLNKVSNETLGGFSPTLNFAAGQPHMVDCWYTGRVQNGKATQVGRLTCKKS